MSAGEKIREIRKAKGLTQTQLAKRAGISSVTLCRLEYGKHKANLSTLKAIASALRVSWKELV